MLYMWHNYSITHAAPGFRHQLVSMVSKVFVLIKIYCTTSYVSSIISVFCKVLIGVGFIVLHISNYHTNHLTNDEFYDKIAAVHGMRFC